jgi:hypothetical protein
MRDNQRMTDDRSRRSRQSLLLAAIRQTLAKAADAATNPEMAAMLAAAVAQHEQLAAGCATSATCDPLPGAMPAGQGRWMVAITGEADEQQECRRASLIEARCVVDMVALAASWTVAECGSGDGKGVHGTLVDGLGVPQALYEIAREERP